MVYLHCALLALPWFVAGARTAADQPCQARGVTLAGTRLTLGSVCDRLTESTGIRHIVAADVADLHVTFSFHQADLSTVRSRIGEVMNLDWNEETGTEARPVKSFRLTRSARNRAREAALADAEESAFRKQFNKLLQAARSGEADLQELAQKDDGVAYTLTQSDSRDALELVSNLPEP